MLRVAVPDLVSPSYFPAIAAVELGYFKQEGLDATIELLFPVTKTYEELRDGRLDFVAGAAHAPLYAFKNWDGCKLLAALSRHMYWFLVLRADLAAKRGDLNAVRGLRIGAAPGPVDGLKRMLAESGIDPERDVNIGPVPGTAGSGVSFGLVAAKALEEGKLDGFWANGMGAEVAVRSGIGTLVLDARRGDGPAAARDYTFGALVATQRKIDTEPDVVAGAVRALVRAQQALRQDPACATEVGKRLFPAAEAGLIAELIRRDAPFYEAAISMPTVEALNAFARNLGLLSGPAAYEQVVATRFQHLLESRLMPERVLIAGGGPVGMVTALALAQRGFPVTVFEAEPEANPAPRAATTHAATLEILAGLGLTDEAIRRGVTARKFQFRDRPSGELIAEFDHAMLKDDTRYPYAVQFEQHKLARLAGERLREFPDTEVHFSARVAGVDARGDGVAVTVETRDGARSFQGAFLVGADGGRSTVRKALGIEFEGYTWPERFIVLTTRFDFEGERGYCYRNYLSDPEEWANLFKVAGDDGRGQWRVVFPTRAEETDEGALSEAGVQARLQRFFPKGTPYEVVHRNLYNVHQRVAATFRKGRVLLAGDAAHVNNPIGGLGLNCGIHDGVELADRLAAYCAGGREDELDLYDRRRRPLNIEFVQSQTVLNKKRMEEKDPAVRAANFEEMRATAADPERHRKYLLRTSLIESVRKAALIK